MPRLADTTRTERRRQLIDAARRSVSERGFRSLTVEDVCTEAGMSKGAFYGYFDQKRDLLTALLEDEAEQVDGVMYRLDVSAIDAVERLRRYAREMVRRGGDPAGLQIRADLWSEINADPELRKRWSAVIADRRAVLRRWVEEGVAAGQLRPIPANALASIILALSDGLTLHAGVDPGGFRWTNVRKALDALLDGLPARR